MWVSETHVQQGNELEPIECSGNGKCDRNTGRCLCDFRYTGASCEIRHACPPSRSNNTGPLYAGADLSLPSIGQSKGQCKGSYARMDSFHNTMLRHQLDHLRDPLHSTATLAARLAASRNIDTEGPGVLHDVLFAYHHDWEAHQLDLLPAQLEGTVEQISCYDNFYGPECRYRRCARGTHNLECSGNGLCNATTGKCRCFSKFYSPDCSRKRCPTLYGRVCNLQGTCRPGAGMYSVQRLKEDLPSNVPLTQPILSHDLVGTCACRYPYYGDTCQFRRCPNDTMTQLTCAGHGACMPNTGSCVCNYGYYGDDCSRKRCPVFDGRVCNGQGMCLASNNAHHSSGGLVHEQHTLSLDGSEYGSFIDKQHLSLGNQGMCACRYPYYGHDCSSKHCPIDLHTNLNCSGHGSCNANTGVCACDKGWYSMDCSFKACPTHHGRVCNFHGDCRSSHGHVSRYSARITSGYAQTTTHHAQTQFNVGALWLTNEHTSTHSIINAHVIERVPVLSNTGTPDLLGTCHCQEPYFGESCAKRHCPVGVRNATCSGHGVCDTDRGACICDADYFTDDCSKKRCPTHNGKECHNQGTCVHTTAHDHGFGSCECTYPYHGVACELKHCPNSSRVIGDGHGSELECDGRGTCEHTTGRCICQRGYFGPDCSLALCPMSSQNPQQQLLECNGEGDCDRRKGMCKCHSSFFHGDACDMRHCPSDGGLECSEHGTCNYHTGECRCDPGWKGTSCERLGSSSPTQAHYSYEVRNELSSHRASSQAPEVENLERGDHHSVGSTDNVYYPTGQCRDQPSQQLNETFFFNEAAGVDFSTRRGKTNCRTKEALQYEKCAECGNVPDQGTPGQIPLDVRCEGNCKGRAPSRTWT